MRNFLICALMFVISAAAFAESGFVFKSEAIDDDGDKSFTEGYISDSRMKFTMTDEDNEVTEMMFFNDSKLLLLIDHDDEEITELTKEDMDKMKAQLAEARKEYDKMMAQMEEMPAAQRDMMKGMMGDKMMGAASIPIEYTKFNETETINGWNTTKYVGSREGEAVSEIWAAPPSQLNITHDDFKILSDFGDYMKSMIGDMFGDMAEGFSFDTFDSSINGFPVRTILFDGDDVESTTTLQEIKKTNLTDAMFVVPEDYDREKAFD